MRTTERRRLGFTMIELVVAMSVVAVLASVLLVGVQRVRERARQSECENRLRQVILSVHLYENDHRRLLCPESRVFGPALPPLNPDGTRSEPVTASGYWRLLPYLGFESEASQARRFNASRGDGASTDHMRRQTRARISTLLCPSDPTDEGTNYRFNTGSTPFQLTTWWEGEESHRANGPFQHTLTRLSDISRGLSQVAALSERRKAAVDGSYDRRANVWPAALTLAYGERNVTIDIVRAVAESMGTRTPSHYYRLSGRSWHNPGLNFVTYNHVAPPGAPWAAVGSTAGLGADAGHEWTGSVPPSSNHLGGFQLAKLDGSITFLTDSIDPHVWASLGSISTD